MVSLSKRLLSVLNLVILVVLFGCNVRESSVLPSHISPFDIIDNCVYIDGNGIYETDKSNVNVMVESGLIDDFNFVSNAHKFSHNSRPIKLSYVNNDGTEISGVTNLVLVGMKSGDFDYLNSYIEDDMLRYYPLKKLSFDNRYPYFSDGYCYFYLANSAIYQTVSEDTEVTKVSGLAKSEDFYLSLYQAEFYLPEEMPRPYDQVISLEKIQSDKLAEYKLVLEDENSLPDWVLNHQLSDTYPLLFIPMQEQFSSEEIKVTQDYITDTQHLTYEFEYSEEINSYLQYKIVGNCVVLLVNNPGTFKIERVK